MKTSFSEFVTHHGLDDFPRNAIEFGLRQMVGRRQRRWSLLLDPPYYYLVLSRVGIAQALARGGTHHGLTIFHDRSLHASIFSLWLMVGDKLAKARFYPPYTLQLLTRLPMLAPTCSASDH